MSVETHVSTEKFWLQTLEMNKKKNTQFAAAHPHVIVASPGFCHPAALTKEIPPVTRLTACFAFLSILLLILSIFLL